MMRHLFLAFVLLTSKAFAANTGTLVQYSNSGVPTTVSSSNPLPISGSFTASAPYAGNTGSAVPTQAAYIGVNSGGNLLGLSFGQALMTASLPVTLASNQSALAVTQSGTWNLGRTWNLSSGSDSVASVQSGTWNITNISGTVSLPTGASTAANQTNVQSAPGSSATTAVTIQGNASGIAVPISAASLPLPTGAATSANQTTGNTSLASIATNTANIPAKGQATMANSTPVAIASDQSAIPTKAPVSANGSGSAAGATVSTVTTLSAPANAVGFILQNLDTSTANIRWAVGRTASATLGQQLQPGRDTGFVPVGANVSIIAESGTQNYDIQWVSQ